MEEDKDIIYSKWLNGEISKAEMQSKIGDKAFSDLERVINTVDNWSMPTYDKNAGYQKFKKNHQPSVNKISNRKWFIIIGIVVSLFVLTFLASQVYLNQNEVIQADYGTNQNFAMSDGSGIWLNDGSKVEYNSKNWHEERLVTLTGEALFEVTKGSPFSVNTELGIIQVLGTKFNVRAWGSNLFVECYEGKVQVLANQQKMILTAGQSVHVIQGNMKEKLDINFTSPVWQQTTSRFYNENISDVFAELERQYAITVDVKPTLRKFSGNFTHGDLENALRSICKPLDLKFTISNDRKSVIIE